MSIQELTLDEPLTEHLGAAASLYGTVATAASLVACGATEGRLTCPLCGAPFTWRLAHGRLSGECARGGTVCCSFGGCLYQRSA